MACLQESADKYWCKSRDGVLFVDDFTTALAGRWTILEDGSSGEGWQIVDASDTYEGDITSAWWKTVFGTKLLRVRHNVAEAGTILRIRNDELPNPYVKDSLGRDYPWFTTRIGGKTVNPYTVPGYNPDEGFPYDWAWGGIEHKIQAADDSKRITAAHMHRCGIFSTWVFLYFYVDGVFRSKSILVNLMWQFWFAKHHLTPDELYFTQGKPAGWSLGTDGWYPEIDDYANDNGNFGLSSHHCGSWSVDSYTYFHGMAVVETNYITIYNIPPDPRGANAIVGLPEGSWVFRMHHPEIGNVNRSARSPNGASEMTLSFDDHINYGWEKVQCYIYRDSDKQLELVTEFAPSDYVNGGDIYCFDVTQDAAVTCVPVVPEEDVVTPETELDCIGPCEAGIFVDTGECEAGVYPC